MRVKEGDRIQLGDFEVLIVKVGHRNVHLGVVAPKELTIVRQKKLRQLKKPASSGKVRESPP